MASLQRFDGCRVHPFWFRFLRHARNAGVKFHVNSGKRTLSEQWRLFRQNMYFSGGRWHQRPGRPLTAFPSPRAPHIRKRHAIDADGSAALIKHAHYHGIDLRRAVPGESWHLEANWEQLKRFYHKHGG